MSGVGKTEAVSIHWTRRAARREERAIQRYLESGRTEVLRPPYDVPDWARGVRVEKIDRFCFSVTATEERGH